MKLLHKVERPEGVRGPDYIFWCPGCKCAHGVWVNSVNDITGAYWSFNGNFEKPTFSPSLKITGTEFSKKGKDDYKAWVDAGFPDTGSKSFDSIAICCHIVITNGILMFCGDCTHEFANKSVPMEEF